VPAELRSRQDVVRALADLAGGWVGLAKGHA
jgi:hypothetical protein